MRLLSQRMLMVRGIPFAWSATSFMAADEKWAKAYRDKGFRMIAYGVDVLLLQDALSAGLKALRE